MPLSYIIYGGFQLPTLHCQTACCNDELMTTLKLGLDYTDMEGGYKLIHSTHYFVLSNGIMVTWLECLAMLIDHKLSLWKAACAVNIFSQSN